MKSKIMGQKKLSSHLPAPLHQQLRIAALERSTTVQFLVVNAIQKFLNPKPESTDEPMVEAVREVLASGDELAIENITSATRASISLLQISGRGTATATIPAMFPVRHRAAAAQVGRKRAV